MTLIYNGDSVCRDYFNQLSTEHNQIQQKINIFRYIVYTCFEPFSSPFFYWTILLLILHKFNFRKPVLKIVLAHYVLRIIGDILDSLGSFYTIYYFRNELNQCDFVEVANAEGHPMRWLITRQLAGIFWYAGEIAGDWYPLIRTKAIVGDEKSIWYVYISCISFNLSKVAMCIYHFTINGQEILDVEKKEHFYEIYWVVYLIILIFSVAYDTSVYFVMKQAIFKGFENINFGFLKKFRTISEYRIAVSAIIGIIGLPIIGASAVLKILFTNYNTSLEDLRILLVNVPYYMMFIDQIMLFNISNDEKFMSVSDKIMGSIVV